MESLRSKFDIFCLEKFDTTPVYTYERKAEGKEGKEGKGYRASVNVEDVGLYQTDEFYESHALATEETAKKALVSLSLTYDRKAPYLRLEVMRLRKEITRFQGMLLNQGKTFSQEIELKRMETFKFMHGTRTLLDKQTAGQEEKNEIMMEMLSEQENRLNLADEEYE